jgi:hypothetical protein
MPADHARFARIAGAVGPVLLSIGLIGLGAVALAGPGRRPATGPLAVDPVPVGLAQAWTVAADSAALVATGGGLCAFDAPNSSYYRGVNASADRLVGSGPIRFSWNAASGIVAASGGYWREYLANERAWLKFANVVDSGTVGGSGRVTVRFMGTPLVSGMRPYQFSLTGRLSALSGSSRLSGFADGANLFSASGQVTCSGTSPSTGPSPKPKPKPKPKASPTRTRQSVRRIVEVVRVVTVVRAATPPACATYDESEGRDEDDDGSSNSCGESDGGDHGGQGDNSDDGGNSLDGGD